MKSSFKPESSPSAVFAEALRVIRITGAAWSVRFLPPADRARNAYYAGAVDLTDLENRIRNWERRPTPFRDRA